jgi:sensor histidine kinase regulating citrate/malate metabolism
VAAEANADAVSDTVTIRIGDNGPGIPEHELQVLERGHETELRHSSGLGLWFVHWVVDASNGWITFETDDSDGSVVGLHLPAANGEQSATVPPADAMWKERSFGHRNGQSAAGDR